MTKPFFSVIIPTHNRQNLFKIALDSVLGQTFPDYEVIVVDDGSTDNTKQIVNSLNCKQLHYFYQKNKGPAAARNKGLKQAKGEFVCFLDSDDRWVKEKLEASYNYIKKNPKYKIFHTEEIWYRNGRLLSPKKYHKKPNGFVFKNAVKLCCLSPSTVAVKRCLFEEIGYFDRNLPACEDYDFWLRATAKYPVFLIPKYLTIKEGGHKNQQSKKYPAMDRFRIYALEKILKNGSLNHKNYSLAYNELKRKCEIYITGALKRNKLKQANEYKQLIAKYKK